MSEARDKIQHRIKKILRNEIKVKQEEEEEDDENDEWDLLGHPCRTLSSVLRKYLTCRNSSYPDKMKYIQYVFDFDDYSNISFEKFKDILEEENSDEDEDSDEELDEEEKKRKEEEIRKKYLVIVEILKQNWNIHANDLIIDEDHNEKQENYLESEENSKRFFNKYVLILVQLFLKQCKVSKYDIRALVNYLKRLINSPYKYSSIMHRVIILPFY